MADRNKSIISAGIGAGIIGGIVMAAFAMMYAGAMGMGFWTPLRLIAAPTSGVTALIGGGGILLWGMVIHLMMSAIFGVILAAILPRRVGNAAGFGWGILYGIAVWAVMTFLALPVVNSTMQARIALMQGSWFFEHLLFGEVAGTLVPAFRSKAVSQSPTGEVRQYPERRTA